MENVDAMRGAVRCGAEIESDQEGQGKGKGERWARWFVRSFASLLACQPAPTCPMCALFIGMLSDASAASSLACC
jgi:hypothetical protein